MLQLNDKAEATSQKGRYHWGRELLLGVRLMRAAWRGTKQMKVRQVGWREAAVMDSFDAYVLENIVPRGRTTRNAVWSKQSSPEACDIHPA